MTVSNGKSDGRVRYVEEDADIHDKSRVVLVGPNGCGKSTLLKLLVGDLTPQKGEVSLHRDLKLGRHDQHHDGLFDGLLEEGTGKQSKEMSATKLLERKFGIQTQDARKLLGKAGLESNAHLTPCSKLSGGQKSRVAFAALCATSQNILILDEPTNHLDLDAIQWLEGYLLSVDVPMVIVSHDREFLDQLCTKTVEVERGQATTYKGNYSDYQVRPCRVAFSNPTHTRFRRPSLRASLVTYGRSCQYS